MNSEDMIKLFSMDMLLLLVAIRLVRLQGQGELPIGKLFLKGSRSRLLEVLLMFVIKVC